MFCLVLSIGLPGSETADEVAKKVTLHGGLMSEKAQGKSFFQCVLCDWKDNWARIQSKNCEQCYSLHKSGSPELLL
jgi:hypothetical protein